MPFSSLGLIPALVRAVEKAGYAAPTAIQAAAIPAILRGSDVLGAAQTGSGKTAAYALPLLQALMAPAAGPRQVRALILVPTRELAAQVGQTVHALAKPLPVKLKISVLFGGVSINPQMMDLRGGADIVVATPGRLLDLVKHNAVKLGGVSLFVLDEADRLLDMGFTEEINAVLALLPSKRQNLFFSATFPDSVQALADTLLANPTRIEVASEPQDKPDIVQRAITVDVPRRTQLLRYLILQQQWERVLVFVATKYAAEHVADKLQRAGLHVGAFHGEFSQGTRSQLLADFKAGRLQVLVATDVAARGIDIAGLPAVVNYDLPRSAVDYTHRIGRTGRAGESGTAVSFITADTEAHFRLIENRNDLRIVREVVAGFEPTEKPSPVSAVTDTVNGGIKGARKSKKDKLREAAAKLDQVGNK
ncbi:MULTISPECIES: DEAD/DEAH box helicase [unclassified Janthinobacterium]|uniref:DEAD/DEAH box helicase n=1 Tax=unclassified Janthinobacterium TaxID=2610881 RepID=UPI00161B8D6A|nr:MULTISPECIES: DEAD/DEAH box helicase [unclassified Janthinobacterium]MBB5366917.1 superfamily II DNA/RNA helicase [Janthinobacterium sp. K2C7]MBB5380605.1 superfamily II DNA/RNA helicase [Janthinobacterium sp. K2Li3]MBB5385299.1 superfamily II DNA/RNA helicase [Janthinobacterium sp. K2E3]